MTGEQRNALVVAANLLVYTLIVVGVALTVAFLVTLAGGMLR